MGQNPHPQSYDEYYGIEQEVAEIQAARRRGEELRQRIQEKKFQKRWETEVETVYYEYKPAYSYYEYNRYSRAPAPSSPANLSLEERHQQVQKLLYLQQEPLQEIKGEIQWQDGPVFLTRGYNPIQNPSLGKPRVARLLEDIVIHYHCTWNVIGNQFTMRDYGDCTHFYLVWPKGEGSDYVIFDLEQHSEPEVQQRIEQLKHLSTWAYGSLQAAYKTKNNLAVLRFDLRGD